MISACSGDGKTTTSSASTSSSSGTGGAGGAGGTGESSSSSSASSGGSGGCTVVEQCAPSGPCRSVACVNGACVEDVLPAGTMVMTTASKGDCKRQECDANGNVVESIDDNDKPVDFNICTLDICMNGVPSNPIDGSKEGAQCGTGQAKCMSGQCAGCNSNGNCPNGDVCDKPVCSPQKVCGFEVDVGRVVSNPDPGDCFLKQCDPQGEIITAPAPNEVPPQDMNECDVEVCAFNGVQHMPVPDGQSCGGSMQCKPRSCMSGTCVDGPLPGNETVVGNMIAGDCKIEACDGAGGIAEVNDDTDAPADPNPGDCMIVKCKNGAATTEAAPAGTACIIQQSGLMGTCSFTGVCS